MLDMNAVILANDVPEGSGSSGVDAWSRLAEVRTPTMVACGELDVPFLVSRSREMVDRLPDSQHRALAGMAHLPQLEQPGVVARLVPGAMSAR